MTVPVIARWLLALFFIVAGLNHFRDPAVYLTMMPPWVPWPEILQKVAGAAEVAGGLSAVFPSVLGWALRID